jgi:hypothetical protein
MSEPSKEAGDQPAQERVSVVPNTIPTAQLQSVLNFAADSENIVDDATSSSDDEEPDPKTFNKEIPNYHEWRSVAQTIGIITT